jgi:hypothetical protein
VCCSVKNDAELAEETKKRWYDVKRKKKKNIRKCDGFKKNAMSVRDFISEKEKNRKSVDINHSLICKMYGVQKKRDDSR